MSMSEKIIHDLGLFLPEVSITVAVLLALLTGLVFRKSAVPVAAVLLAGIAAAGWFVVAGASTPAPAFSSMVSVDPLASFFKGVVLLSTLFIVVFSLGSKELNANGRKVGEYYVLLGSAVLGMMLMAGASNLLMMYLSLELSSLSSYLLSGYTREEKDSSEASLKYVIYGALSSGLMVYGISIVYGLTGSLDLHSINERLGMVVAQGAVPQLTLLIAGLLMLAGFGYKISAVPFHFWTPDVYEGAPTAVTAFLSVASKAGGFAMLIRFLKAGFIDGAVPAAVPGSWSLLQGIPWVDIIAVLAVVTMTFGNLVAVWQDNLKRMLAYSSIAHAGYMLTGLVVLGDDGIAAVCIYFAIYLFMNLGAFYAVMLIADKTGTENINDYKNLGARSPFLGVVFALFLVSLTGLPPTAGFIGKLYLFAALVNHGWVWLAVVAAINSVIALYYYVRVFRNMFLRNDDQPGAPLTLSFAQTAILLVLGIPTLLFGLYFGPIVSLAQASVKMLVP
jgi:NADH-quinone oxidoreductase subunit N